MTRALTDKMPESASSDGGPSRDALGWAAVFRGVPHWVMATALVAALLHMMPYWHASATTPPGWQFSGNLTVSPDYMQYRVWERQSGREGPLISNRFTTEPNARHLPVFYYWGIGVVARGLGVAPEAVYAYSGAVFAALLVVLLFGVVRSFLPDPAHARWPFLALVFGGGLGGHLKLLQLTPGIGTSALVQRLVTGPLDDWPVFEDYRSHYVVRTLFDSHFLLLWFVCVAAVYALYLSVRRWSTGRGLAVAALFALVTLLHVYEGLTLVAIAVGVALAVWRDAPDGANARRAALWSTVAVAACYLMLGLVYRHSGLPVPPWRAVNILAATLLIAYPLSWAMLAIGGAQYARDGGVAGRFVLGWALACTAVTLSGPFYPYPDRGTMTMQLPLMIATGAIYFARWRRLTPAAMFVAAAAFLPTTAWQVSRAWHFSSFRDDAPFMHLSPAHVPLRDAVRQAGDTSDILLAEPRDLLWLAPEFAGRLYVGHFFLTVDYKSKNEALSRALQSPDSMAALLARSRASLLFVHADRSPQQFGVLPGLVPVASSSVGTLFRVTSHAR